MNHSETKNTQTAKGDPTEPRIDAKDFSAQLSHDYNVLHILHKGVVIESTNLVGMWRLIRDIAKEAKAVKAKRNAQSEFNTRENDRDSTIQKASSRPQPISDSEEDDED